jgi:hypothetical protein
MSSWPTLFAIRGSNLLYLDEDIQEFSLIQFENPIRQVFVANDTTALVFTTNENRSDIAVLNVLTQKYDVIDATVSSISKSLSIRSLDDTNVFIITEDDTIVLNVRNYTIKRFEKMFVEVAVLDSTTVAGISRNSVHLFIFDVRIGQVVKKFELKLHGVVAMLSTVVNNHIILINKAGVFRFDLFTGKKVILSPIVSIENVIIVGRYVIPVHSNQREAKLYDSEHDWNCSTINGISDKVRGFGHDTLIFRDKENLVVQNLNGQPRHFNMKSRFLKIEEIDDDRVYFYERVSSRDEHTTTYIYSKRRGLINGIPSYRKIISLTRKKPYKKDSSLSSKLLSCTTFLDVSIETIIN